MKSTKEKIEELSKLSDGEILEMEKDVYRWSLIRVILCLIVAIITLGLFFTVL